MCVYSLPPAGISSPYHSDVLYAGVSEQALLDLAWVYINPT
jgi:hypothetical protein